MRIIRTIRFQLMAIILICYLIPTLILGLYIHSTLIPDIQKKTENMLGMETENALDQSMKNLERIFTLARDATYDGELNAAWASQGGDPLNRAGFIRLTRNYIERKYNREDLLTFAGFFALDDPELFLYNRSGYQAAEHFASARKADILEIGCTLDTECRMVRIGDDFYLIRELMDNALSPYGILVLGINRDLCMGGLDALADSWSASAGIRITGTESGSITEWGMRSDIRSSEGPAGLTRLDQNDMCYSAVRENRDVILSITMTIPVSRIYGETLSFRNLGVFLVLLLVPALLIVAAYVWNRIVRPIRNLSSAAGRIEAGELGVTVPSAGGDELGQLSSSFSHMSLRLKDLIDRTYKEEIALRDAQIQAMQSRINPHFINNALESINWQARMEGADSVSASIESLSVLLNACMSRRGRRLVPLAEELEVAHAYFHFVLQRFGDALNITEDIPRETLSAVLPLLTIQPIIENAVEHGINPAGGGTITLKTRIRDERLHLEIRNTGKEPGEEDLCRMRSALSAEHSENGHLGLANISSRLRLIYQGKASISAEVEDHETVIRLDIPVRMEPAAADAVPEKAEIIM
ncbi:MAG: histidine kinase [Clostridia bacterium]|nr:histidine kinase [Clostridia bacterium]